MCIGCKLANGEMSRYLITETENLSVILDLYPHADGHVLILPKNHYESLNDLPAEVATEVMSLSQKLLPVLKKALDPKTVIVLQNNGAMNSLKHYHMHLVPHTKLQDIHTLYDTTIHSDNSDDHLKHIQKIIIEAL